MKLLCMYQCVYTGRHVVTCIWIVQWGHVWQHLIPGNHLIIINDPEDNVMIGKFSAFKVCLKLGQV